MVCCQPPDRTAASSAAMWRVNAMIIPRVSSGTALPVPEVPQTVMPRSRAAARSIAALAMPVVTSSRSVGSRRRTLAGNAVRSRMATTTSLSSSASTRSVSSAWCSVMARTLNRRRTADQSALLSATFW